VLYVLLVQAGWLPSKLLRLAENDAATLHRIGFHVPLGRLGNRRTRPILKMIESRLIDGQLRRLGPDLLHFTDHPSEWVRFRPVAVTLHGVAEWPERFSLSQLRISDADAVICSSWNTAQEARRLLEVRPGRIAMSYLGVDTSKFRPSDLEIKRPPESRYFLHVGTLRPNKNPNGLLRAFAEVASETADVSLISVGPYEVLPLVKRNVDMLSRSLGIGDRVRVLSTCGDADLVSLYQGALGLIFPSFGEGFGFPILEALACGTPCVTSNRSSMPEVAGDLCQLVDPNDPASIARAMKTILRDRELASRVRSEGPRWATRFSWAATAEAVFHVYLRLLSPAYKVA
jgi:glycosyltransferase involved in cell wall biosynthesis